jgi:TonB family protein
MRIAPVVRRRLHAALFTLVCLGSADPIFAQASDATELVPPRLTENAEPEYPRDPKARGEGANVTLLLEIDETGRVTRAVVATSGGAAFDDAAIEASTRLRFAPATRGGRPIRSKIPFQFTFAQPAEPEGAASPPSPDAPANGAPPHGAPANGTPPTGSPGAPLAPTDPNAPAADGGARGEDDDDDANTAFVDIQVKGQRAPRETTKHVLDREELRTMPGTNGDAIHAVENLPGVARTTGFSQNIIVRGSAPQDTGVFADGVWLVNAFHFGGITSVVPTEVLERLDFYPGNFSPEYGRQMGGIIDLGIRSPRKDRFGGLLQFDLLDGRFLAEAPLGKSTRFLLAGRRSWIDSWLGPALKSTGAGVTAAPVYYDYQAMIEQDLSSSTTARLLFFGSDDRFKLNLTTPSPDDPGLGGDIGQTSTFYRLQGRVDSRLSDRTRWINMVSFGHNGEHFELGTVDVEGSYRVVDSRSDLRAQLGRSVTAVAGLSFLAGTYDVTVVSPMRPADGEVPAPLFGSPLYSLSGTGNLLRPAAYAMLEVAPANGLKLVPGVRVDYSSEASQVTVDPRVTARYDIVQSPLRTTLKGGVGVFHQPPQPFEAIRPFGSPNVKANYAIHRSLGIEQQLSRDVDVSMEGFYKDLRDLVVGRAAATSQPGGTNFANTGEGRTYGTELLARWKPGGTPFSGFIAYTISRSERRIDETRPFTTFEFDQTHILNAVASYKLGRGWTVGGRFRYVTGNPYTPYLGAVADLDAGVYTPIASPALNSGRVAPFHSLDLRVDKTWTFTDWKLTAYLDLRNAYNRQNPEAMTYNYNYSQSKPLAGLPILPIVGLRGEL